MEDRRLQARLRLAQSVTDLQSEARTVIAAFTIHSSMLAATIQSEVESAKVRYETRISNLNSTIQHLLACETQLRDELESATRRLEETLAYARQFGPSEDEERTAE